MENLLTKAKKSKALFVKLKMPSALAKPMGHVPLLAMMDIKKMTMAFVSQ